MWLFPKTYRNDIAVIYRARFAYECNRPLNKIELVRSSLVPMHWQGDQLRDPVAQLQKNYVAGGGSAFDRLHCCCTEFAEVSPTTVFPPPVWCSHHSRQLKQIRCKL